MSTEHPPPDLRAAPRRAAALRRAQRHLGPSLAAIVGRATVGVGRAGRAGALIELRPPLERADRAEQSDRHVQAIGWFGGPAIVGHDQISRAAKRDLRDRPRWLAGEFGLH